jgi:hypothetical protein
LDERSPSSLKITGHGSWQNPEEGEQKVMRSERWERAGRNGQKKPQTPRAARTAALQSRSVLFDETTAVTTVS